MKRAETDCSIPALPCRARPYRTEPYHALPCQTLPNPALPYHAEPNLTMWEYYSMGKAKRQMDDMLDLSAPISDLLAHWQAHSLSATTYAGIRTVKTPCDAWMYQQLVFERRPAVIVEIGNWCGGTLLMLAHWLDAIGSGRVIGVDVEHSRVPELVRAHPRIELVTGDAVQMAGQVAAMVGVADEVLVIEDSSHTCANTLAVLQAYAGLVRPGGYFIVEDTICHHGLAAGPQPGPWEAVQAFLLERRDWQADRSREAFGVTWNPGGYLRRIAGG